MQLVGTQVLVDNWTFLSLGYSHHSEVYPGFLLQHSKLEASSNLGPGACLESLLPYPIC